jgi:hypothetical protein
VEHGPWQIDQTQGAGFPRPMGFVGAGFAAEQLDQASYADAVVSG